MSSSNRAALINKTHKVLKKYFKPVVTSADRSLLDNLLYAHCLQDATYEKADEAFAQIKKSFFDWNEVRVTTVAELAEVIAHLPHPSEAAANIRRTLQSVFESTYSFDLEGLKKQNIGQTVKKLGEYAGVTSFAMAYVTQHCLGGHAIPLDRCGLELMYLVGAIDESEREQGVVPGLERVIPKKKGVEFASLLHQAGAEYCASPFLPQLRAIVLEISPDAQARFPKRTARKTAKPTDAETPQLPPDETAKKPATRRAPTGKKDSEPPPPADEPSKGAPQKKSGSKQLAKRKPR